MSKKTTKTSATKNVADKIYILELTSGGIRKVTVPASWRLTFGPTIPYAGKGMTSVAGGGTALRFYEGNKENLRAVFTDVKAFRDAAMPVMERRTQVQRKVVEKKTPGGTKNVEVEARVTEWVNPDDVEDSAESAKPFLQMIADSSD